MKRTLSRKVAVAGRCTLRPCFAVFFFAAIIALVSVNSGLAQDENNGDDPSDDAAEIPDANGPADEPLTEERVAAGDWGATLDAFRSLSAAGHEDEDRRTSAISAALWARRVIPSGEEGIVDLALQGSYNWSTGQTYLNLDLARVRGRYPGLLGASSVVRTSVGRIRFQDPSGLVLNETADGASAEFGYPAVRFQLAAAYTGLMLNPVSTARMSAPDLIDEADDGETFAPRRAFGLASITLPELLARQTVVTGVLGQLDLRDADDTEETVDSGFALLGIRGPVVGNLYHDIYGVGTMGTREVGSESSDFTGYAGSARLRLFLPEFLASRISFRGIYASGGDPNGSSDGLEDYLPISRNRIGSVFSVPLQNLAVGELSYSMRPMFRSDSQRARRFGISVAGRTFFTTSDAPVRIDPATEGVENAAQITGIDPDPNGNVIGTETVLRLNARVLSDLGLGVTAGMFFPNSGSSGVFTDDREAQFLSRIELSSRF